MPFVEAAYALQQESVRVQADCVQRAFIAQRDFLSYVSRCRCPPHEDLDLLLQASPPPPPPPHPTLPFGAPVRLHPPPPTHKVGL